MEEQVQPSNPEPRPLASDKHWALLLLNAPVTNLMLLPCMWRSSKEFKCYR